jgi:hypothetical protein
MSDKLAKGYALAAEPLPDHAGAILQPKYCLHVQDNFATYPHLVHIFCDMLKEADFSLPLWDFYRRRVMIYCMPRCGMKKKLNDKCYGSKN